MERGATTGAIGATNARAIHYPAMAVHTPEELRDLLATVIAGAAGGDEGHWRELVGAVTKLPLATNVLSNWSIAPAGKKAERAVIEQAAAIVRAEHPYVS